MNRLLVVNAGLVDFTLFPTFGFPMSRIFFMERVQKIG